MSSAVIVSSDPGAPAKHHEASDFVTPRIPSETFAAAIRELRPDLDIVAVTPAVLAAQQERIERLSGYIGLLEARYTPEEIDELRADVALREDDIADVFDAGYP